MMKSENYYEFLEVDQNASTKDIRLAYLQKLKQWHPDKNAHRLKEAEEITKILNQAYYVLRDPQRRRIYDKMLKYTKGQDFKQKVQKNTFWTKLEKASPAMSRILRDVAELYGLFTDSVKGNYKLHPISVGIIGGGLLYFIIPTDFIPDVIPVIGYLDDVAVLSTIISVLKNELEVYRNWKKKLS